MKYNAYLKECPGNGAYTITMYHDNVLDLCAKGNTPKEAYDKFMLAYDVKYNNVEACTHN